MKKMILIFSHRLTDEQIKDAKDSLGVEEFIYLPEELQKIFSNIPCDVKSLENLVLPIKEFIQNNSSKEDYVLVQGDFGTTYILVNYCFKKSLNPIYSTTKREAISIEENNKVIKKSIFKHSIFRAYENV